MDLTHSTYNEFHLGDNLMHLHFLRKLSEKYPNRWFVHSAHGCHLDQLSDVIEGRPNIGLTLMEDRSPRAINSWKNANAFFERHANRSNYYEFHLDWFRHLAGEQMGLESPFTEIGDLLFDYPALDRPVAGQEEFDFLVVNSRPCSGQFMAYDRVDYFDPLLAQLVRKGHRVLVTQPSQVHGLCCTMDRDWTVSQIGSISRRCRHHLMVSTGPSWPVLNQWNYGKEPPFADAVRMLFLETERLNLPGLLRVITLGGCQAILEERGLL